MKVLTVRQPWAWAIMEGHKDVENRSWRPSIEIGERFAIHAGMTPSPAPGLAEEICEGLGVEIPGEFVLGAVLGTVRLMDCSTESRSPWAIAGQKHWILAEPIKLTDPIPARGKLSLWDADPSWGMRIA